MVRRPYPAVAIVNTIRASRWPSLKTSMMLPFLLLRSRASVFATRAKRARGVDTPPCRHTLAGVPRGARQSARAEIPNGDPPNLIRVMPAKGQGHATLDLPCQAHRSAARGDRPRADPQHRTLSRTRGRGAEKLRINLHCRRDHARRGARDREHT